MMPGDQRATPSHVEGVVVGTVTDNQDPEDMGRVKVTYPWREADDESYWARIATPMAGGDRGTYFLPEVDDEVLVAFEHGDIRFPYVVGALWNGNQQPPATNEGNNDVRLVRSRSGHEIVLDDAENEAKVELVTSAGHTITLDDKSGSETITIEDTSGQNSLEFDATAGTLTIQGGTKLELKATNIDLKADGNMNVEASGMLTLKGAMIKLN